LAEPFRHQLRVRYNECDPQGVVFNAHYLTYFDTAMTELWRETLGPYSDMLESGTDMVVGEARARFHAPATFDDELRIEVTVTRLGTTGMTTALLVRRRTEEAGDPGRGDGAEPELLVEGELRHVFVDRATRRKKPIPEEVRRALAPFARESAAAFVEGPR
jgi:acyl-CoA thioester hydrolase